MPKVCAASVSPTWALPLIVGAPVAALLGRAARATVTVQAWAAPFSAVTAVTISWSPARSGGTVIPSVTSLSVIAVPSRVTALADAPSAVVIAVSVTGVTALPTSTA